MESRHAAAPPFPATTAERFGVILSELLVVRRKLRTEQLRQAALAIAEPDGTPKKNFHAGMATAYSDCIAQCNESLRRLGAESLADSEDA